jgi:HlyD family secretion protein
VKQRLLRMLLIAVVVAAAAFGGWYFFLRSRAPEFTYRTVPVERGRVVARVTATGTLSAYVTVLVGSQVSGRVSQINVDFNSPVKKGQLIAKIDPQIFEAALAQSRANLFAAQGNLTKARAQAIDAGRQLARSRSLQAEGIVAQVDLDAAETNEAVAKAQIEAAKGAMEQARAAVQQAEINLAYTNIASPIDGVVISRSVDVGQTVAASLQAPTLFTIAQDLRKMQVDTNIAEGDVGKLHPDMAATFLVDAYPNERFKGTIRQIRNAPQTVQNVVTYDAVIDVDNADLKLKPGMTANVTLVYAEREGVITVPNTALRFRAPPALAGSAESGTGSGRGSGRRREAASPPSASPPGSGAPAPTAQTSAAGMRGGPRGGPRGESSLDRRVVWVLRGAKPERVPVRTGLTDGTVTEILEGDLTEGDAAVVEATSGDEPTKKPADGAPPRLRL